MTPEEEYEYELALAKPDPDFVTNQNEAQAVGPRQTPSDEYNRAKAIIEGSPVAPIQTAQQSLAASTEDWKRQQGTGTMSQGSDPSDLAHKIMAFSAAAIPGYTALAQGSQRLSSAMGLPAMTPGQVQQEITRAAEENPFSRVAGGVAQGVVAAPTKAMAAIPAGQRLIPAMQTGAGLAGMQYLTEKMNIDPNAPASEVLTELPVNMAAGALGGGVLEKYLPTQTQVMAPIAKKAAKGVRDWADTYARQTLGIDPDTIMSLERTPSRIGLGNRYEDVLEELSTNIIPSGPLSAAKMSPIDARAAALRNLKPGEEAIEYARTPMRLPVKGSDLLNAFEEGAVGLERQNVLGGKDAADLLRREGAKLVNIEPSLPPVGLVQAQKAPHQWSLPPSPVSGPNPIKRPSWESEVNLQNLEDLATSIRSPEYQSALRSTDPDRSTRLAAEQLQSIQAHETARVTGRDPMEILGQSAKANEFYEPKRKAAEVVFGVEGRTALPPSVGYVSSAPVATQAGRGALSAFKDRGARAMIGANKKALAWATKNLNERLQNVGPVFGGLEQIPRTGRWPSPQSGLTQTTSLNVNLSPYQLENFIRQVDTLSRMDPGDFSVALYAMSTTDPVFNALWKKSQEDEGDGIMQAETNRTDQ